MHLILLAAILMADESVIKIVDAPKQLASYSVKDGKVSASDAQALARKVSIMSAKFRLQRARAEFAEAQAIMTAAQRVAEQENQNLETLLKSTPGYQTDGECFLDDAADMVCKKGKK